MAQSRRLLLELMHFEERCSDHKRQLFEFLPNLSRLFLITKFLLVYLLLNQNCCIFYLFSVCVQHLADMYPQLVQPVNIKLLKSFLSLTTSH